MHQQSVTHHKETDDPITVFALHAAFALIMLCAVMLAPMHALAAEIPEAAGAQSQVIWKKGPYTVYAIQDRPGGMDISLFSGPATPEERAKYFTDGKASASISVFLVKAGGQNVLIDAGFGTSAPGDSGLIPELARLGLKPENIDAVLLTHMHTDHVGGLLLNGKRAFPRARVAVSKPELDYWLSVRDPENANARLVHDMMKAYGTDVTPPFALGSQLMPGLSALDAVGHTPGHTAFLFQAEGQGLLIVGDLVHAATLQFALPDECARYDMDRDAAVASRKRILGMATDQKLVTAGMHMPFPGYGKVERKDAGFTLLPASSGD